ncbi:MAG: DUF4290 domain-containing protein [Bacteroidales bacterium]
MDYNTQRNHLVIPEYGRNIQQLVEFALTIEDRGERTRIAYFIVNIMAQMHPSVKESGDYRHKLWDHLHIISDFKLDVESPFEKPNQDELYSKPERLPYGTRRIRFRHYGKNLISMIQKAKEFEEGEEKNALIQVIANHMKKSYLTWNRDSVNDELILKHLEVLSDEELNADHVRLHSTSDILKKNKKKTSHTGQSRSSSNSGSSYGQRRQQYSKR